VVTGGSSLLPGFKERFEQDLYDLANDTARTDIKIDIDLPRRYSAWVGGSMIASLSTFDNMTIKASEYEENAEAHQDAVLKRLVF
jgi:actin-related protein